MAATKEQTDEAQLLMTYDYNKKLKANSQKLRREMTEEEKKLWYQFLKDLPITVKRQKIIGNYIVDFYCAAFKTVLELDGMQHFDEEGEVKDKIRDEYLNSLGITVLRYSNKLINENFQDVCTDDLNRFNLL